MLSPDKVAVIIPCFNEADAIALLVREVKTLVPQIYVINDGSSDETANLAQSAGAEVFSNAQRLGKGTSILRGLKIALSRGFAWAILMDGDGQHASSDIPRFLDAASDAALIIGNRMPDRKRMPWIRKTVNRWMSRRISKLAGCDLPDTQCGFRLVNLEAWKQLRFETTHFEMESEMVLAFVAAGYPVDFVPVKTIYKSERSKIRPIPDAIRWFRWYFRVRQRFAPLARDKQFPLVKNKNPQAAR